jgi:hypothetical protein
MARLQLSYHHLVYIIHKEKIIGKCTKILQNEEEEVAALLRYFHL